MAEVPFRLSDFAELEGPLSKTLRAESRRSAEMAESDGPGRRNVRGGLYTRPGGLGMLTPLTRVRMALVPGCRARPNGRPRGDGVGIA